MSFKSGFISIIGRPNAGKSTLLNRILGEKIAAVSPKPQTTRTKIMGVVTDNDAQMIFLDTPGIHKPKNKLGKFMMKEIEQSSGEADIILYMTDAADFDIEREREILKTVKAQTVFLLINKTDAVEKQFLLPIIAQCSELRSFEHVIPISAKHGHGFDILMPKIKEYLPDGPKFFPDDTLTDQPEKQICSELIREKMMRLLSEEVPYGTAVVVEEMKYDEARDLTEISAVIHCERDSHKGIIIGKKGDMLKKIGTYARQDIERFTGTKVFLRLWVKVKENWRNNDFELKNFGYKD